MNAMHAATAQTALAPWIARQVQALLPRPGHAWLLQGPSGQGQFDLALALARAWLCDTPGPQGACGHCQSCHGIDVHTHPDLVVLLPETELLTLGWPLPEKAQTEIDDKKRKPSREVRVDAMRSAIEFAQRTSARGRGKVVLVYPAERMNAITANALLKTLEEPAGDTRFVLASDAAHLLLPTIRSRCLNHTMPWPAEDEALAWLVTQGLSHDAAAILLRASGGRPAQALALAGTPDIKRRGTDNVRAAHPSRTVNGPHPACRDWASLPCAMAQGDSTALAGMPLPEAIARLQKLCHDLMAVQIGAVPRYFSPDDLPRHPVSLPALSRWWQQLIQSACTAEHTWKPDLAAEFLANAAQQALNSRS